MRAPFFIGLQNNSYGRAAASIMEVEKRREVDTRRPCHNVHKSNSENQVSSKCICCRFPYNAFGESAEKPFGQIIRELQQEA